MKLLLAFTCFHFEMMTPSDDYEVTDAIVISRCGSTPLNGKYLHNRVVTT